MQFATMPVIRILASFANLNFPWLAKPLNFPHPSCLESLTLRLFYHHRCLKYQIMPCVTLLTFSSQLMKRKENTFRKVSIHLTFYLTYSGDLCPVQNVKCVNFSVRNDYFSEHMKLCYNTFSVDVMKEIKFKILICC